MLSTTLVDVSNLHSYDDDNVKRMYVIGCKSFASKWFSETPSKELVSLEFILLPRICSDMTALDISTDNLRHFSTQKLVEPQFNVSGSINVLLDASDYKSIIEN